MGSSHECSYSRLLDIHKQKVPISSGIDEVRSIVTKMHICDSSTLKIISAHIPYHMIDHQATIVSSRQFTGVQVTDLTILASPVHNAASLSITTTLYAYWNSSKMINTNQRFCLHTANQITTRLISIHIYISLRGHVKLFPRVDT